MPPSNIKLGRPTGEHGCYSFYRSFRYLSKDVWRCVQLGKFFFARISKDSPVCIGELQLVWTGRQSSHALVSVKLYYLPEQTPEGRLAHHGQDELVATEKVVLYAKDLVSWITLEGVDWSLGLPFFQETKKNCQCRRKDGLSCNIQILNYNSYCRIKTALKRMQSCNMLLEEAITDDVFRALYGLGAVIPNSYVMFSREVFDNPELERHEYRCDHLAPNLKGRPRKKTKSTTSAAKEASGSETDQRTEKKVKTSSKVVPSLKSTEKPPSSEEKHKQILSNREKFLKSLYQFMKENGTPINKIPSLGFKKVDLFSFYRHAHNLGGYQQVCQKRMWKHLYDLMGGNPHNTSAANCTKRQYERLLLTFEKHLVKKYGGTTAFKLAGTKGPSVKSEAISKSSKVQTTARMMTPGGKSTSDSCSVQGAEENSIPSDLLESVGLVSRDKTTANVSKQVNGKPDTKPCTVTLSDLNPPDNVLNSTDTTTPISSSSSTTSSTAQSQPKTPPKPKTPPNSNVVSASATWKVPVADSDSSSSSALGSKSTPTKTDKSKDPAAADKPVSMQSNEADPSTANKVNRPVSLSKHRPGAKSLMKYPAHCVQRAPMPLNILGPCYPSLLAHAQRSPWTVRLGIQYQDPNIIYGSSGAAHKINELKRAVCDHALDLSAKRRKVLPEVSINTDIPASIDKMCGAIDLSAKRSTKVEDSNSKPVQLQNLEPVNYSKPKKERSDFCLPPSGSSTHVKDELRTPEFPHLPAQMQHSAQYATPPGHSRGLPAHLPNKHSNLRTVSSAPPSRHYSPKPMYSPNSQLSANFSPPITHQLHSRSKVISDQNSAQSHSMQPLPMHHMKASMTEMRPSPPKHTLREPIQQQTMNITTLRCPLPRPIPINRTPAGVHAAFSSAPPLSAAPVPSATIPAAPPPAHNSSKQKSRFVIPPPNLSSSTMTLQSLIPSNVSKPISMDKSLQSPTLHRSTSDQPLPLYATSSVPPPAHSSKKSAMVAMAPSAFSSTKQAQGSTMSPPMTYGRDRPPMYSPPSVSKTEPQRPISHDGPRFHQPFNVPNPIAQHSATIPNYHTSQLISKPGTSSLYNSPPISTSSMSHTTCLPPGYRSSVGAMPTPLLPNSDQQHSNQTGRIAGMPTFPSNLPAPPRLQPIPARHLSRHSHNQ